MRNARNDYNVALENIADTPDALIRFKEYYAAWEGALNSMSFVQKTTEGDKQRLNELCSRVLLEVPPVQGKRVICMH